MLPAYGVLDMLSTYRLNSLDKDQIMKKQKEKAPLQQVFSKQKIETGQSILFHGDFITDIWYFS